MAIETPISSETYIPNTKLFNFSKETASEKLEKIGETIYSLNSKDSDLFSNLLSKLFDENTKRYPNDTSEDSSAIYQNMKSFGIIDGILVCFYSDSKLPSFININCNQSVFENTVTEFKKNPEQIFNTTKKEKKELKEVVNENKEVLFGGGLVVTYGVNKTGHLCIDKLIVNRLQGFSGNSSTKILQIGQSGVQSGERGISLIGQESAKEYVKGSIFDLLKQNGIVYEGGSFWDTKSFQVPTKVEAGKIAQDTKKVLDQVFKFDYDSYIDDCLSNGKTPISKELWQSQKDLIVADLRAGKREFTAKEVMTIKDTFAIKLVFLLMQISVINMSFDKYHGSTDGVSFIKGGYDFAAFNAGMKVGAGLPIGHPVGKIVAPIVCGVLGAVGGELLWNGLEVDKTFWREFPDREDAWYKYSGKDKSYLINQVATGGFLNDISDKTGLDVLMFGKTTVDLDTNPIEYMQKGIIRDADFWNKRVDDIRLNIYDKVSTIKNLEADRLKAYHDPRNKVIYADYSEKDIIRIAKKDKENYIIDLQKTIMGNSNNNIEFKQNLLKEVLLIINNNNVKVSLSSFNDYIKIKFDELKIDENYINNAEKTNYALQYGIEEFLGINHKQESLKKGDIYYIKGNSKKQFVFSESTFNDKTFKQELENGNILIKSKNGQLERYFGSGVKELASLVSTMKSIGSLNGDKEFLTKIYSRIMNKENMFNPDIIIKKEEFYNLQSVEYNNIKENNSKKTFKQILVELKEKSPDHLYLTDKVIEKLVKDNKNKERYLKELNFFMTTEISKKSTSTDKTAYIGSDGNCYRWSDDKIKYYELINGPKSNEFIAFLNLVVQCKRQKYFVENVKNNAGQSVTWGA